MSLSGYLGPYVNRQVPNHENLSGIQFKIDLDMSMDLTYE